MAEGHQQVEHDKKEAKRVEFFDGAGTFKDSYQKFFAKNSDIDKKLEIFRQRKSAIPLQPLPKSMSDHQLQGKLKGIRDCHLAGDIILLYTEKDGVVTFLLICDHDDIKAGARQQRTYNKIKHLVN